MEEAEARPELAAVSLDRPPDGLVLRVVVDDQDLEIRVIEPRQRVEGLDQHLRRLVVGRDVNRHFRQRLDRHGFRSEQARVHRDPVRLGPLMRLGEQHQDHAHHADEQQAADECARDRDVLLREVIEDPGHERRRGVDDDCEEAAATVLQRTAAVEIEQPEQYGGGDHRGRSEHVPVRDAHDRLAERELLAAVGVVDAPVGADPALRLLLPGLVEGLHHVIRIALALGMRQEAPQEQRLVRGRGDGGIARAARTRPAHLADHDRLAGELLLEPLHLVDHIGDRGLDLDAFPVGEHVHGDEIDVLGEFRMPDPHVPRFGGADGLPGGRAHAIEVGGEVRDREVAAQDDFVADDQADDVPVAVRELDGALDFALVAGAVGVEPRADRDLDVVARGDGGNFAEGAEGAVGPHRARLAFEQREVTVDLLDGRLVARDRVLVLLVRLECEALDDARPGRLRRRAVRIAPRSDGHAGEGSQDQQAGELLHRARPTVGNEGEGREFYGRCSAHRPRRVSPFGDSESARDQFQNRHHGSDSAAVRPTSSAGALSLRTLAAVLASSSRPRRV